ncbi:MAG: GNAT family N-acetyltransferase [Thermoplasmata archaeon]|nr:GNAT family N-acetyltransferase [Thermoplasmata archaeon]
MRGRRVELRPLRRSDADGLDALLRDRPATRWLPPRVRTETGARFVRRVLRADGRGEGVSFAICPIPTDEAVGQIRLFHRSPVERSAEVGYFLRRSSWGQGFATDALRLACRYGFGELGLHRIQAKVIPGNEASRKVLENVGFVLEGTQRKSTRIAGRWLDVWEFGLVRGELRSRRPGNRKKIEMRPRPRVHRPGARARTRRSRSDRRAPLRPRPEGRPVHPQR